jgi:hypothetical protein
MLEGGEIMLVLYYFNWAGTLEEFREFAGHFENKAERIEGVEPLGIFAPSSEWHYVMVMKTTSYEKALQSFKKYMKKYGRPKTSLGKIEIFHTFEELGYPA